MNSFFVSNANAKGPGFGLFSLTHLITLCILGVISFFICRYYFRASLINRNKLRIILASSILLLEVFKDIALLLTGQFTFGDLPFQLCGIGIFIVAYDAFRSNKTSRELMYSLTLPGAIAALLTPDWVTNHFINLFVWQSFIIHTLLVSYVLMQMIAKEFQPQWRQLWRVIVFLLIMTPLVAILNQQWHQNFFYIETPVAGSPLEPIALIFGSFYILGMVLLVAVIWLLMYLPWIVHGRKKINK